MINNLKKKETRIKKKVKARHGGYEAVMLLWR